jgi:hypothetical protein
VQLEPLGGWFYVDRSYSRAFGKQPTNEPTADETAAACH